MADLIRHEIYVQKHSQHAIQILDELPELQNTQSTVSRKNVFFCCIMYTQ